MSCFFFGIISLFISLQYLRYVSTFCSKTPTKAYSITVTTGKAKKAGTNASVRINLVDENGRYSDRKTLNRWFHNDFEYGRVDTYDVNVDLDFGRLFCYHPS